MKRICLFICLFYFTLTNVLGQIRFSKFYDYKHTANLISDVAVLGDTGYFTVSQCVDLKQKDTLNYQNTYLYIIRTNSFGDTVFTKVYYKPRFNIKGADLLKTNWGYFLAGEEYDLKKYEENSLGAYIKMWKINRTGDTIATQKYDIQNGDDLSVKIIKTNDNGFAVFGQTCNQIQSGKKCNNFLMKLDSNGNKQWHKIYKQSNTSFENPNSLIQMTDGTFYLFGQSTLNSIMKWFLVKTDSAGNLLWQKTYNEFPRQAGMSIMQINNMIILAGSYATNIDGTGTSKGCAMLIDTSGNKIWNKSFGGPKNCAIEDIVYLTSQSILLCGANANYNSSSNLQAWVLAINIFNGDSLYQSIYNSQTKQAEYIYKINKASDGFVLSGFGVNPNDCVSTQDAWLLKVDSFGCITPGCQLVGINNIPFSREEIKIYPNPANYIIQFEHSGKILSYRIADYTGKLLMAGNYLENGINVEHLPSGTYVVQVLLEGKVQAFGKLLKK